MTKVNNKIILEKTQEIFANGSLAQFSIRNLVKELDIAPSVIYHHFENEAALLMEMYLQANSELGKKRAELPKVNSAKDMLLQRINFQLDNFAQIVAVLKYFQAFRKTFPKQKVGFLPPKSTLHIEEVLTFGQRTGEFNVVDIKNDSMVITHAINGFLLEYYPHIVKGRERKELVKRIYDFVLRALEGGEKNG